MLSLASPLRIVSDVPFVEVVVNLVVVVPSVRTTG